MVQASKETDRQGAQPVWQQPAASTEYGGGERDDVTAMEHRCQSCKLEFHINAHAWLFTYPVQQGAFEYVRDKRVCSSAA
jgi:hypothetical protein